MNEEQRLDYFRKGLSAHALQVLWVLDDHSLPGEGERGSYVPDDIFEATGLPVGYVLKALDELVNRRVIKTEITEEGDFACTFL